MMAELSSILVAISRLSCLNFELTNKGFFIMLFYQTSQQLSWKKHFHIVNISWHFSTGFFASFLKFWFYNFNLIGIFNCVLVNSTLYYFNSTTLFWTRIFWKSRTAKVPRGEMRGRLASNSRAGSSREGIAGASSVSSCSLPSSWAESKWEENMLDPAETLHTLFLCVEQWWRRREGRNLYLPCLPMISLN